MKQYISSDFKLGIIAGGQLGKMLCLAANNWDVKTYVLDPDANCPASSVCEEVTIGDYKNFDDVYLFCKKVDIVTLEIEHVNVEALRKAKSEGVKIYPDPEILAIIQDKGLQKEFFKKNGIPTAPFSLYKNGQEIVEALEMGSVKRPFVQKLRTMGYDGKGVVVIKDGKDMPKLIDSPSVIENAIDIAKEISVIVARDGAGNIVAYPPVEMSFNEQANLVEELICPAQLDTGVADEAVDIAKRIIDAFNLVGILAVEMFLSKTGQVLVNEVAPRPHNSGHHTIESVTTSQYEQQLRTILGLPLGATNILQPSIMLNLLGEEGFSGPVVYEGFNEVMGIEGVKVHVYGKKETKPYRKMGHVTVMDNTIEKAKIKANKVKTTLKVKSWKKQ